MAKRKIEQYILYYTPGGAGNIHFRLAGEVNMRTLGPLSPEVFTALAAVLSQRGITWEDSHNLFMAFDDDYGTTFEPNEIA